jgi:hypothetical protein
VGATVNVLGAQGVPGFPKFSDTDGWASMLTAHAAIPKVKARAINFLFLICYKSSKWLNIRSSQTKRTFNLNPPPEILYPLLRPSLIICAREQGRRYP